jgi:hypothetical protein
MRDIDCIDRELRLLSIVRATLRQHGAIGTTATMDRLLDERLLFATVPALQEWQPLVTKVTTDINGS